MNHHRWFAPRLWGGALCLLALAGRPVPAQVVLNEILIDPAGSDGGREYVELLNRGDSPADLGGLRFEFANGAAELDWRLRWEGLSGEILAPGQRYLIVDRNWQGEATAQAEVTLALQNGPDSVRLARDGATVDLLGYGALTGAGRFETAPAPLETGRALARRPDGRDTDDNAADFVAGDPTPGAPNFLPWSLTALTWSAEPPSLAVATCSVRIVVRFRNDGLQAIPPADVALRVGNRSFAGRIDGVPPGGEHEAFWDLVPGQSGSLAVGLAILPPAAPDTLAAQWGRLQVGPAELVLNEVLAAPGSGQQEWIEVLCHGAPVDAARYRLRDEDGPWRPLPALRLGAGESLVVAQDSTALSAWLDANAAAGGPRDCDEPSGGILLRSLSGAWPSLNNESAAGREFADRVYLGDETGQVLDHVEWGGPSPWALPPPDSDVSLERISLPAARCETANWAPSTAQAGSTPGCANSRSRPAGEIAAGLRLEPRVLDPARGVPVIHVMYRVEAPDASVRLRIFDLWGGLVRDLAGDGLGAGPRHWTWDGRDDRSRPVAPGAYIVSLTVLGPDETTLDQLRAVAAVQAPSGP